MDNFFEDEDNKDVIEQAFLATAFNLAMEGSSRKEVEIFLTSVGWDEQKAKQLVAEIFKTIGKAKKPEDTAPSLFGFLMAFFLEVLLVTLWGDLFFKFPQELGLERIVLSFVYVFVPLFALFFFWFVFSAIFPKNR